MKNITLISDWKLRDPYIAVFKGKILRALPDANILDITHAIPLCDTRQTAFLLQNSYASFPDGTLHIVLTGAINDRITKPIWLRIDNHYFVGNNNGIFSILLNGNIPDEAREYYDTNPSLPYLDKIIQMIEWHFQGKIKENTCEFSNFLPVFVPQVQIDNDNKKLTGQVIYIDSFCNAVTDISDSLFKEFVGNHAFTAKLSGKSCLKISKYCDYIKNLNADVFFAPNQFGFIEIVMYKAHIAALSDLAVGDKITISL